MKALIWEGPEKMVMENQQEPTPKADEVIIKVEAVGICGSELEGYLGHSSIRVAPLIMGHEFCGTIHQLGEGVSGLQIGERAIINPLISCGKCESCVKGHPNICHNREIIGIHRPGAFAEYVNVPVDNVHVVPDTIDPVLASLAEPLAVSIHAVKLGYQSFENLMIFGAGPIGLLTLQVAKNMGAEHVLVIDKQEERLNFAKQLGADTAIPEQVEEKVDELFGKRGVNTVIECVGVEATRESAIQLVNPGGRVVMVGLGAYNSNLNINHVVRQEISITGSYTYTNADFEQAVSLLSANKINRETWSTIRPLAEGPVSFQELVNGMSRYSKIILQP